MDTVTITGKEAVAATAEGVRASVPVRVLVDRLAPPDRMDTGKIILPDGVKSVVSRGPMTVMAYEMPPRVHNLKWIARDSPAPFGPGAKYRTVRLAQPYIIVLAVFGRGPDGRPALTGSNECFYRVGPLKSLADELLYPALLNCSKFEPEGGHPLSWICTQYLKLDALAAVADSNERLRNAITALLECLLDTGFNYSSENHEANSWFSESARRVGEPRIKTVEDWQEAGKEDPLFVLNVKWLPTGRSLAQVIDRIFLNHGIDAARPATSSDIARLILGSART
ncbi:MAG: hypothetical protein FJ288_07605 [Planctomycetes bacterium]|nr:hypothetical protein [Planctomycetota bacterium]